MKIQLIKTDIVIGNRVHAAGDIVDLEIDGNRKRQLVELGHASWHWPAPIVETPTSKPAVETATRVAPRKRKGEA